jgi:hypothetical protein
MALELNGTTGVQGNSGAFVAGTAVASTSGTSIDFTSIPSWVKRITVMVAGVSTDGSSVLRIQLGTSSGVVSSGYLGTGSTNSSATASSNFTSGFDEWGATSTSVRHGSFLISLLGSNNWTCAGGMGFSDTARSNYIYGSVSLGGTLDRVRITTANGTDTFDAGTINILYE